MGERGRRLAGLAGMGGKMPEREASQAEAEGSARAHEVDEDSDGKTAAMEELHAAMHAEGGPDHARMARAMGDFHDLHASARRGNAGGTSGGRS
jgi:hypothetical protein